MKLLLDTHIWLWSAVEPDRLSRHIRHELTNQENEVWLSPISAWEALVLYAKGRIQLDEDVRQWMDEATSHLREAPLTRDIGECARHYGFYPRGFRVGVGVSPREPLLPIRANVARGLL